MGKEQDEFQIIADINRRNDQQFIELERQKAEARARAAAEANDPIRIERQNLANMEEMLKQLGNQRDIIQTIIDKKTALKTELQGHIDKLKAEIESRKALLNPGFDKKGE